MKYLANKNSVMEKSQHGGARPNSGRKAYSPEGGFAIVNWKVSSSSKIAIMNLAKNHKITIGEVIDRLVSSSSELI